MPSVAEAASTDNLNNGLLEGFQQLSNNQQIPLTQYIRYVLPLDGYVYWLKTATTLVSGSLHVKIISQQREDETYGLNRVVLTTGNLIEALNKSEPNTVWIAEAEGVRFAFSEAGPRYKAAGIFHYAGDAVYPAMESQLVDVGSELSKQTVVVSNSLPAWLTLVTYKPFWLVAGNPGITLYPSFLVPENLRPPYGSVHIEPGRTTGIEAAPLVGAAGLHTQLSVDQVRVTLYGLTNAQALAFQDLVIQYASDTEAFGVMNIPVMQDEKRTQVELGVIAMKKTITFEVDYYQWAMPNVARQMLKAVSATIIPEQFAA